MVSLVDKSVGQRVREARERAGFTREEASERLGAGFSVPTIRKHEDGERVVKRHKAMRYAARYGVSLSWIEFGGGSKSESPESLMVPVLDVNASAGAGALVDADVQVDSLSFRSSWLRSKARGDLTSLRLIHADGDSMSPTIEHGDLMLVDPASHIPAQGIFILRLDGALLVKRLTRGPGHWTVSSDNPLYPPFSVPADGLDLVGEVIWFARSLR